MTETKCYKIRDKRKPGLWKLKGGWGSFNKNGKTWSTLGALSGALSFCYIDEDRMDNWEIVEFTIHESSSKTVREYMAARNKL